MKLTILVVPVLTLSATVGFAADWQQEISDLREDVLVLKRRVKAKYESGVSAETNDLQVQSGKRGEAIRELNIRLDDLDHQLEVSSNDFDKIRRDIEIRIKMLEGKPIPEQLSAPVANIPTTYEAPVATEAARAVVGDEIRGEDLAPIDDYSDMQFEY